MSHPKHACRRRVGRLGRLRVGTSGTPGGDYDAQYGYEGATARLSNVTGPGMMSGMVATYGYLANTDFVEQILTSDQSRDYGRTTRDYEDQRDLLTSVDNWWYDGDLWGRVSQYEPAYDDLGRVDHTQRTGPAFADNAHYEVYGYNERNELTGSVYYTGTYPSGSHQQPKDPKDRAYQYDPIGNRTSYTPGTQSPATTYTANGLNGYTATANPSESFSYDDDGNLTADGTYRYEWDGENRLRRAWLVDPDPEEDEDGDRRVNYVYDYVGRRVEKTFETYTSGQWLEDVNERRRFIWDGWKMLAEYSSLGTVLRSYTWGLDLAGQNGAVNSLEDAGTIGGLLAVHDGAVSNDFIYFYDANGNVGQVVDYDAAGAVVKYEYDAYGNRTNTPGEGEYDQPFRFSTKYWGNETGLGYWGYRYYSPRLGRWISRDPIGERGNANLYAYCANRPANVADTLGMQAFPPMWFPQWSPPPSTSPTQPANTCVVELWCSKIEGLRFRHCEWRIANSESGEARTCTCGPRTCPAGWYYKCCLLGCLGCDWASSEGPGYGERIASRSLPESACVCLRSKCSGWKPRDCYGLVTENSNTGARCLNSACGLGVGYFDVPFSAIGWGDGGLLWNCSGML